MKGLSSRAWEFMVSHVQGYFLASVLVLALSLGLYCLDIGPGRLADSESGSLYLTILFLMPLVPGFIFWARGKRSSGGYSDNVLVMFFFTVFALAVFLGIYSVRSIIPEQYQALSLRLSSWASVISSVLLAGYTLKVIGDLISSGKFRSSDVVDVSELKDHPRSSIGLFLVIFFCITYFMGFAFAFDDKASLGSVGDRSLYSNSSLYINGSGGDGLSSRPPSDASFCYNLSAAQESGDFLGEYYTELIVIESAEGPEISMKLLDALIDFSQDENFVVPEIEDGLSYRDLGREEGAERTENDWKFIREVKKINTCSLWQISELIWNNGKSSGFGVQVEAYRTATPLRYESHYGSQHELLAVRSANTVHELNKILGSMAKTRHPGGWPNSPVSFRTSGALENVSAQTLAALGLPQEPGKDGIEGMSLAPVRMGFKLMPSRMPSWTGNQELSLLDYVYFSFYTVTTTGYGDIIPIKPYSRFLTTLCNMFEIFYFVVFFNLLLSLFRNDNEGNGGEENQGSDEGGRESDSMDAPNVKQQGGQQQSDQQQNGQQQNGQQQSGQQQSGQQKNGKQKNGKQKNGKQKNGKQKNGKQKNGKQKNGK